MNWTQGMLDDEAIFPSKIGASLSPRHSAMSCRSCAYR